MFGFSKGCRVKCAVTGSGVTSHTANFHVTVQFCFITPQITAVRNVEIHFGRGSDCKEVSKNNNNNNKQAKKAFIALAAEGAQKRAANWEGGKCLFFLDTFHS